MQSYRFRVAVGSALAVVLLAAVLWGLDLRAVGAAIGRANPWLLGASVVVTMLAYGCRAWRWQALLAPVVRVPVPELNQATLIGFAASLVIPRSGELLRPWLVARRHPVAASAGFATIVVERVVDLVCVLSMFALYLLVLPRPAMETHSRWMEMLTTGGLGAGVVAALLLALLWSLHACADMAGGRLSVLLAWVPGWLATRVAGVARGFAGGLAVMRAPLPHWARIGCLSALVWLPTIAAYHCVHLAFGLTLPFQVTLLLTAFLVVGESIPTPGLIGGFHAFYVLALCEVYGVDRETAAAVAIAAHALTNLPVLLAGAWYAARGDVGFGALTKAARAAPAAELRR